LFVRTLVTSDTFDLLSFQRNQFNLSANLVWYLTEKLFAKEKETFLATTFNNFTYRVPYISDAVYHGYLYLMHIDIYPNGTFFLELRLKILQEYKQICDLITGEHLAVLTVEKLNVIKRVGKILVDR